MSAVDHKTESTFRFSYRPSLRELAEEDQVHRRLWLSNRDLMLLLAVCSFLFYAAFSCRSMGLSGPSIPFALVGAFFSLPITLRPWLLRRIWNRRMASSESTRVELGPDGVLVGSSSDERFHRWSDVTWLVNAPEGILICGKRQIPIAWLPRRVVGNQEQTSALHALAVGRGARLVEANDSSGVKHAEHIEATAFQRVSVKPRPFAEELATFDGRLTYAEYAEIKMGAGVLFGSQAKKRWVIFVTLFLVPPVGVQAYFAGKIVRALFFFVIFASVILLPILTWPLRRIREFRRLSRPVEIRIDGEGVVIKQCGVENRLAWSAMSAMNDRGSVILFGDERTGEIFWFPERGFQSAEEREAVLATAERHGVGLV